MLPMATEKVVLNEKKKYVCEYCDYKSNNLTNYNKHLMSRKHKKQQMLPQNNNTQKNYICVCGNIYKHKSSYYRHKKVCEHKEEEKQEDKVEEKQEEQNKVDYKEMFMKMLNQNKELQDLLISQQEEFIKQQQETNKKFENLVLHIKPNNTINNKTINNNNNKTFNIMMFLNDKCKDAMTIQDFAEKLVITIEDLEKKKFDCLSNTILKNLKSLAITERPVHCGNIKKKEWYLHDKDNGWELDNGEKLIKNTEYGINKKFQNEFKKHYPHYLTVDNIQDKYMRLINRTFTDLPENEKSRLLNILSNDFLLEL
jgi:hypothetical protein